MNLIVWFWGMAMSASPAQHPGRLDLVEEADGPPLV
jgi:hypothetical protein